MFCGMRKKKRLQLYIQNKTENLDKNEVIEKLRKLEELNELIIELRKSYLKSLNPNLN